MKISEKIKEQIYSAYTLDGNIYINYQDVAALLMGNYIDNDFRAPYPHSGFDSAIDQSLFVFYYSDGSALVVNGGDGITSI